MLSRVYIICLLLYLPIITFSQADNEIQVYSSPTTQQGSTMFELHSNYTFKGSEYLSDPKSARWTNESLEITHGFSKNFELGFYTFTGIAPGGSYQYLGNHIRPRVTVPSEWGWRVGASLSVEFGFIRPVDTAKFIWEGEIRPILDKTFGDWYITFNPNMAFVITGDNKGVSIGPQLKTVYTIKQKVGVGIEYYSDLGTFRKIAPGRLQEHLLGPMLDLYLNPKWEVNTGFLFGLTKNSNHDIVKLLIGRRI